MTASSGPTLSGGQHARRRPGVPVEEEGAGGDGGDAGGQPVEPVDEVDGVGHAQTHSTVTSGDEVGREREDAGERDAEEEHRDAGRDRTLARQHHAGGLGRRRHPSRRRTFQTSSIAPTAEDHDGADGDALRRGRRLEHRREARRAARRRRGRRAGRRASRSRRSMGVGRWWTPRSLGCVPSTPSRRASRRTTGVATQRDEEGDAEDRPGTHPREPDRRPRFITIEADARAPLPHLAVTDPEIADLIEAEAAASTRRSGSSRRRTTCRSPCSRRRARC